MVNAGVTASAWHPAHTGDGDSAEIAHARPHAPPGTFAIGMAAMTPDLGIRQRSFTGVHSSPSTFMISQFQSTTVHDRSPKFVGIGVKVGSATQIGAHMSLAHRDCDRVAVLHISNRGMFA